jgi:hypothetical protein
MSTINITKKLNCTRLRLLDLKLLGFVFNFEDFINYSYRCLTVSVTKGSLRFIVESSNRLMYFKKVIEGQPELRTFINCEL